VLYRGLPPPIQLLGEAALLKRLRDAGFSEVGNWIRGQERVVCELVVEKTSYNILYAFVSGEQVLYVGKTTIPLRDRMYQYQRPGPTQRTNMRVNAAITEMLESGASISVYALPDPGDMEYRGFHLNLAAGIEDGVIRELQPKWNKTGR